MQKFIFRASIRVLTVISLTTVLYSSATAHASEGASASLIFMAPLNQPDTNVGEEYSPLSKVLKIWHETYDGRSRYQYLLLGKPNSRPNVKDFMQDVAVYDGEKEIKLFDWDGADCSFQKILLAKDSSGEVYLFVAMRSLPNKPKEMPTFADAAPQLIQVFRLINNDGAMVGKEPAYFTKIAEHKTTKNSCEADAVYNLMKDEASKLIH